MAGWRDLVHTLGLQPHPEGGYFKETYRSAASTAIYYLLPPGTCSKLHRLPKDEMFHWYGGGTMTIVKLGPAGEVEKLAFGHGQHLFRAGWWFGGWCDEGSPYVLIGCTVAPAFEFPDLEFGDRAALTQRYPSAASYIERLT